MPIFRIAAFIFSFFISLFPLNAQQSSKTKSKEKLYEKTGENKFVKIRNATALNSNSTDFSPTYYKNGLVYVSSKKKDGPVDKNTKETYFELYFSPFDPNGEATSPSNFSLNINSSKHEGPVTFKRDYKTMYFTRNNMEKGVAKTDRSGVVQLKIYEAQKGKNDWADVRELPFNSDNYTCMHPSLDVEGKTLYFASNMPGGEGGYDIYKVTKTNTGWSKPINLGAEINSSKDEVFPFSHPSGTLFFASNGHNTLGGLDIFFADAAENTQQYTVVNIGEPYNSTNDDLGFIINDEGTSGYFSSDRSGGYGKDDIYMFTIETGIVGLGKVETRQKKIRVTDAKGNLIQGAEIRVLAPSAEGFVDAKNDPYKIETQPIDGTTNSVSMRIIKKGADDLGAPDGYSNAAGEATFEFTKYKNYFIMVSKAGFLAGDAVYNMENDNQSDIHIQLNTAPDCHEFTGKIMTDEIGHRIANVALRFTNRATNQQIKGHTDENGEFKVCLPGNGEYFLNTSKPGYAPQNVLVKKMEGQPGYSEVRLVPDDRVVKTKVTTDNPYAPGMVIRINDIHFEPKKATIGQSVSRYLNSWYDILMQYPSMEIDLVAHTDSRGSTAENQALSIERANNCKKFLVYRGIQTQRINAIGKGESQLLNHCKDDATCTDEEHNVNTRLEIVIRKIGK